MLPKLELNTIVALASAQGSGAISLIRLSGKDSIEIINKIFKGKDLTKQKPNTIHFGFIKEENEVIDEVLVSIFKAPNSFTKENSVEITCHGSSYIIQKIIELLIKQGARLAAPGEFTKRAFINGRFDLTQAEAIADLIASDTQISHNIAMNNLRGGISKKINEFRNQLINFASLLELELDFSEEDVEFADRNQLINIINELTKEIKTILDGFKLGNAVKKGVPVVIVGKPNVGKSTLLNVLLNEERAIVSDIPGTTRDFIEDQINIEGINFRFVDTAGIRKAKDKIEAIGIDRTFEKMKKASLILYLLDLENGNAQNINLEQITNLNIPYIIIGNKLDKANVDNIKYFNKNKDSLLISAYKNQNIDKLKKLMIKKLGINQNYESHTIISNARHYDIFIKINQSLNEVLSNLKQNITSELIVSDIRIALNYLGEITGEITTDDLLDNIFSKFCIGK
ncbi:MAG: tRNA uridine-5-carboxymethylaminomethyl(34) synthesis GTPase MnmE [Bacteroidetes bacterium]|nr:tRNA uridine-5-carboxymethylaminomethyl(34) synthesis GTPase MnmE [Bacteroidota bacterium]